MNKKYVVILDRNTIKELCEKHPITPIKGVLSKIKINPLTNRNVYLPDSLIQILLSESPLEELNIKEIE